MLVLHGNPMSTCTRRVLVALYEIGLVVDKDFKVEAVEFPTIKTPEWLAHQPFGQMPWLEDTETGIEVFESRAIAKYVAAKTKSSLLPTPNDLKAFAKFEQACSVENADFDPPTSGLAYQLVFGPRRGVTADPAVVENLKKTLATKLEGYERILAKTRYLAGDQLSLADLYHLPYGVMAIDLGGAPALTDGSLPNVARWWKEISSLKSWADANAALKK